MNKWAEFFKNDKNWNAAKSKIKIDEQAKLSRVQLLKSIGSDSYSEKIYQEYLKRVSK